MTTPAEHEFYKQKIAQLTPAIPVQVKKLSHQEIKHPAKFSTGFVQIFRELLIENLRKPWRFPEPLVLDPFAGVGTIHELRPEFVTFGMEIEQEWADCSHFTYCGDSTTMPDYWTGMFQAICTSPVYGNRMSDHHTPGDCSECFGVGTFEIDVTQLGDLSRRLHRDTCPKCQGTGKESSKRMTYRHVLGHELQPNNTGQFQFTQNEYKQLHFAVYQECYRVLEPGGIMIVNVSDHIRQGKRQPVCKWHELALKRTGFTHIRTQEVNTTRMGFGANHDLRVETEEFQIYRRAGP